MKIDTVVAEWSRVVAMQGALLVIGAGLLPWFHRLGEPSRGFEYAGWYAAVAGLLVVLALVLWFGWQEYAQAVTALLGVAVVALARANYTDADALATHDLGTGLQVLGLGGALLLVVPVVVAIERSDRWNVRPPVSRRNEV